MATPEIKPIKQFAKAGDNYAGRGSSDGTYIYVPSVSTGIATVSKYDLKGTLIWERNLNQGGGLADATGDKSIVADDGSIITTSGSGANSKSSALARFTSAGEKLWEINSVNQEFRTVTIKDNEIYIGGRSNDTAFVSTYSLDNGKLLWSRNYPPDNVLIHDILVNDNNLLISATTNSGFGHATIGKLDLKGNIIWWKDVSNSDWNSIDSIKLMGNELIGSGYKADGGDRQDARLMSINLSDGSVNWDKSWGDQNAQGYAAHVQMEIVNREIYVAYGDGVPFGTSALNPLGYSAIGKFDDRGNQIELIKYDNQNAYDRAGSLIKVGQSLYLLGQTNETIAGQSSGGGSDIYLASVVVAPQPTIRGNSLYTIVDGPSWTQAEANSVKLGGHLVTINDADERRWLSQNIYGNQLHIERLTSNAQVVSDLDGYFVGLNDKAINGNLQWAGNSVTSWTDPSQYILANNIERNLYTLSGVEYGGVHSNSDGLIPDILFDSGDAHSYYTNAGIFYRGIAETPFIRRGDSAYVIVQGPTWEEAEANAIKLGGHLVTINDKEENEWLHEFANIQANPQIDNQNTRFFWTGLNDAQIEGDWRWSSGEPYSYANWAQGEPNDANPSLNGEDFVDLGMKANKQWNDFVSQGIIIAGANELSRHLGIAEIKLTPNNIPTGTPTVTGTLKVGSTHTINTTAIKDSDNFTGYTPNFNYTWEVSTNGTTWTKLTTTDATDNNTTYTLTTAEVGKQVRGVVSYLDGYGTNESVATAGSAVITNPSPTYTLIPSATSVNERSSISYTLTTTNVVSGTNFYYQFSGTGINAADFSSATTTGTEVVGSNGQLTITRTLTADKTTEGTETLTLKVFTDSTATTLLATNAAVTVNDVSLTSTKPTQQVYTLSPQITYKPTDTISIPLLYTTSSGDANLSGLTLNLHYNSSILTPSGSNNGVSGQVSAAITSTAILPDTSNLDNDPLTDKIIQLVWATFDSSFPNKTLPAPLATISFNTAATKKDPLTGQPLTTTVRYTASETAAGYDFLTGFTTFKAQSFNLDVDGDGKVTALGDGLMVIRKLFGAAFAGDALTYKAMSPNATRTTAEISDFIQQGIDGGMLDVDKDGKTTALGDGLMVIRRLFGAAFDGAALINKAISPNSPYFGQASDFNSVGINVDALKPVMPLI